MKKFNPNKNIIITLILVIILVTIISLTAAQRSEKGKTNVVQGGVNNSVSMVDRVISFPARGVENGLSSMGNLINTFKENERLKEKIDSYNELNLNETLANYEKVTANVITRSPDTWQDLLIIDKGTNDGIEAGMAVMAQKGLVGRVIEVNATTAKVELLTSKNVNSNHFPVRVTSANGESFGLLKNYDNKTNALIVSQLTGDATLKEGDVVQTSGLGGNSPADLAVGTVIKVKPDSFGLDREVYVKPYADVYGISVVTVVKRSAGESE